MLDPIASDFHPVPMTMLTPRHQAGLDAEQRVLAALRSLPVPWQTFHAVEWRLPGDHGERIGEADIIVFHPQHGLIVLEVKSGQLSLRNGQWYQGERAMQKSPFAQARHNLYALKAKLEQRLGKDNLQYVALTHAAWFPGCVWRKDTPLMDVPSAAFVLDRETLEAPEPALLRLLREAAPDARPWHTPACNAVKELLAADCQLLMPMRWRIADAVDELMQATEDQMRALRLLRGQSRLLVQGGAGSGKTLLALNLAREQANAGKTVLLTCFNRYLAQQLAEALADRPGVTVLTFHDLTAHWARQAGLAYVVPKDAAAQSAFYREGCAELLMQAAETPGATRLHGF